MCIRAAMDEKKNVGHVEDQYREGLSALKLIINICGKTGWQEFSEKEVGFP